MSVQVVGGQLQKRFHWGEVGLLQSHSQQEYPTARFALGLLSLSQPRILLQIANVVLELADQPVRLNNPILSMLWND
jgi:hypothetical protein